MNVLLLLLPRRDVGIIRVAQQGEPITQQAESSHQGIKYPTDALRDSENVDYTLHRPVHELTTFSS
jgi:hypothetical protein